MGQSGASLMLKQRSQNTTWSRTATRAAASVRASASGARSKWYVRRWAVLGPTPGSRANASMRRATGSISGVGTRRRSHARDAEPAGHGRHLLLGDAPGVAERVVDGGDDQVLEHLDISRVDRVGIDRHRDQLLLARDDRGDDAAAGRAVDRHGLELALDAEQLLLHLLGHPLQVAHPHVVPPPLIRPI